MNDSSATIRTDDTAGSTAGATFTPGPWAVVCGVDVWDERGAVANIARCGKAEEGFNWSGSDYSTRAHQEGNARLISAAPDFYEGAIAFAEYLKAMDAGNDIAAMGHFNAAKDLLRLAVEKAEGR